MPVSVMFKGLVPVPPLKIFLERAGARLLRLAGVPDKELSIVITSDAEIQTLNSVWFGRHRPTNCISFPQEDGPLGELLGDVVISLDTCRKEAAQAGMDTRVRLLGLLVHGLSHLMGYDHELGRRAEEEQLAYERRLLNTLRKEEIMAELCVNVDHVATIRQARGGDEPDPVVAAGIVELAGADGIVVHLRGDRRHIQERDVRLLREIVSTRLTLEMATTEEMIAIAEAIKPDFITLVPERPEELTTEGGLDIRGNERKVQEAVERLNASLISVTIFVDPEETQIEAAKRVGAQCIELHTGRYAEARTIEEEDHEYENIARCTQLGAELGLSVHAGHGLNYRNVARLAALPEIEEFSIGHSIISRAVIVGLERAVKDMIALIRQGFIA